MSDSDNNRNSSSEGDDDDEVHDEGSESDNDKNLKVRPTPSPSPTETETSPRKSSLRHKSSVYYERKLACSDCKLVLPSGMSMKEHMKTIHPESKRVKMIKYSPPSSQGSGMSRKCQLCGKGFRNPKSLSDHRKVCTGSPKTPKRMVSGSGRKILVSTPDRVAKIHASWSPSSREHFLSIKRKKSIGIGMTKTCERCATEFRNPKQSSKHRKKCLSNNVKRRIPMNKLKSLPKETSFQCYICFKLIPRQNYSEHLSKEYKNSWNVVDRIQKKAMRRKETPGPGFVFHCQRCPTLTYFKGKREIAKHVNKRHKDEPEED